MEIRDLTNFEELTVPEALNVIGGNSGKYNLTKESIGNLSSTIAKYKFAAYCKGATKNSVSGDCGMPAPRPSRP